MRLSTATLLLASVATLAATLPGLAWAQGRGLTAMPDALGGPVWQARFEHDAPGLALRSLSAWQAPTGMPQSLRLLGDYQFSTLRLGETGGLRLTGGLLVSLRHTGAPALAGPAMSAQPYAGVGYASGSLDGRWGFSADIGLAAAGLGPLRLERPAGALGADSQARILPMVRLGMTLAF